MGCVFCIFLAEVGLFFLGGFGVEVVGSCKFFNLGGLIWLLYIYSFYYLFYLFNIYLVSDFKLGIMLGIGYNI